MSDDPNRNVGPPTRAALQIVGWADAGPLSEGEQTLRVPTTPLPCRMSRTHATGRGLVSNGRVGVDLIRIPAGTGFEPHAHPGDHLLIVVAGRGTITYRGAIRETRAGQVYLVAGDEPHAVGAITDHVIMAVGCPHRPVDASDRMSPREYRAVVAPTGELRCLICDLTGLHEGHLSEQGCPHDPASVPLPDAGCLGF